MKKSFFAFAFLLVSSLVYAQVASIFGVDAQAFLRDEKNIIRYNPLNIFDNKSDTVFAVNRKSFDKAKPIIRIFLGNSIDINELKIKGGYFDKRYFKANYRIKSGEIVLSDEKKELIRKKFFLADDMTVQSIKFDSVYKACEIQIYVSDFYDFERWNDIVISDISFYLNNASYACDYGVSFSNSYVSYKEENNYNEKNQLIYQSKYYPKFFGFNYKYTYDSNGRLIFAWRNGGDAPTDTYEVYEYSDLKSRYPSEIQKFEKIENNSWKEYGIIFKPYTADANGKILKSDDFNETVENIYENDALIKKIKTTKGSNVKCVYYYQNGKCILEENSDYWIYVYKYENNILKYKMPVKTTGADVSFYEYFFDKGNLTKVNGYTHKLR